MSSKSSKKRKNVETESASSSATRQQPKRFAREDSALAGATSNLMISSSYDLDNLPSSASGFRKRDMEAMRVSFKPASAESAVIPDLEGTSYIVSAML